MTNTPIKRNINLTWLSKEHHLGLLAIWKINQGIKLGIDTERIKKYIFFFWENLLKHHFAEEEILLFNTSVDNKVSEAFVQHDSIRKIIKKLQTRISHDLLPLQQLAEELEKHIRFEERILFPYFEKILTAEELQSIGTRLEKCHEVTKDNYGDEFWLLPHAKKINLKSDPNSSEYKFAYSI